MNLKKNLFALAVFLTTAYSHLLNAQCTNPAWDALSWASYSAGDIVSNDGKDWEAISSGSYQYEPSGSFGYLGWTLSADPCASSSISEPVVAATEVRANYCTTSFGVGTITSDGGSAILERGFVFGTSSGPDLSNADVLIDAGTGTGDEFEGLMENLTPETDYYIRTYATNAIGTTYGTEASFTTRATSECVSDCNLACDMTDSQWEDPTAAEWSTAPFQTVNIQDTVCITQDVTISSTISLYGMFKICNGATVTLNGAIKVYTATATNPTYKGQVVYEGCNEIFDGIGSYSGEYLNPPGINDPLQMISYCGTCDDNDQTQFFKPSVATAYWAATCRPTTSLSPLPVELIYFATSPHEEGALLTWTTASEINNSHFEIEVSYDGTHWNTIGLVQGAGNTSRKINYSFIDNNVEKGVQYYRLKQIDYNGDYAYSNIRYFSQDEKDKPTSFVAFQNIENKIEVSAVFHGAGQAYLIDMRGRIVEMKSFISSDKAGVRFNFDSYNLNEGVYFVQIKSGNALLGQKVQFVQK